MSRKGEFIRGMGLLWATLMIPACGIGAGGAGPAPSALPGGGPQGVAAEGSWTWVSGPSAVNGPGTYGAPRSPSFASVPGARSGSSACTSPSGEFWLFGGSGFDQAGAPGELNDLWKFDGLEWTWVSGSSTAGSPGSYGTRGTASPTNVPGARSYSMAWTDLSGILWLFGGTSFDSSGREIEFDDVWRFDGSQWTWAAGSPNPGAGANHGSLGVASASNTPGALFGGAAWSDQAGNLWLFGGQTLGSSGTALQWNDLWKFDGSQWTWISGSNRGDQGGVYGTIGTALASNHPGGRTYAAGTRDSSGNFWLFGGLGIDANGATAWLNDLWKFDGTAWTWVSGSNQIGELSYYGTEGVSAAGNTPGARFGSALWADPSGRLWLFGGTGHGNLVPGRAIPGNPSYTGNLNDLWKFESGQWTWISGSNYGDPPGVYGTKGVPSAQNTPGGREPAGVWIDGGGRLWIFGGVGQDALDQNGFLNDVWSYSP